MRFSVIIVRVTNLARVDLRGAEGVVVGTHLVSILAMVLQMIDFSEGC
jgi:hypothetical protein